MNDGDDHGGCIRSPPFFRNGPTNAKVDFCDEIRWDIYFESRFPLLKNEKKTEGGREGTEESTKARPKDLKYVDYEG